MAQKAAGYAGRKFSGRRVIDNRTPGMPSKHQVWAGLSIPVGYHVEGGSIKKDLGGK